ncbi:MAG: hypothetical protein K1X67_17165, partial [Fimbriimonadaceae bacterium]|nr:hypothetical protein [Fimbriimonadaceae bacterium]
IRSCEWLAERHVEDITVCPTRVAPRTVAWELYKRGLYRPPQLTSLAIVLQTLQKRGIRVRASMFNVSSSDFAAVVPETCSECGDRTRIAIEAHCLAPGEVDLDTLCGACQKGHERADADVRELSERVEQYWQCLKHEQCGAELYAGASGIP